MNKEWLIWSLEHNAWWGKSFRGYVENVNEAGRYTFDEAMAIVHDANINLRHDVSTHTSSRVGPNEAMIHESVLDWKIKEKWNKQ